MICYWHGTTCAQPGMAWHAVSGHGMACYLHGMAVAPPVVRQWAAMMTSFTPLWHNHATLQTSFMVLCLPPCLQCRRACGRPCAWTLLPPPKRWPPQSRPAALPLVRRQRPPLWAPASAAAAPSSPSLVRWGGWVFRGRRCIMMATWAGRVSAGMQQGAMPCYTMPSHVPCSTMPRRCHCPM